MIKTSEQQNHIIKTSEQAGAKLVQDQVKLKVIVRLKSKLRCWVVIGGCVEESLITYYKNIEKLFFKNFKLDDI